MYTEIINPRFNESDAFGHINNSVYTIWFDLCRQPIVKLFDPTLQPKSMQNCVRRQSLQEVASENVFFGL